MSGRSATPARAARRRHDLPLRPAVADDRGLRARCPAAAVLQYHNITPAAFFAPYDAQLFRLAALGRQELRSLAGPGRPGARRFGVQPPGAGGAGLRADRGDADRRRHRTADRGAAPARAREDPGRRATSTSCSSAGSCPNKRIEDHIRLAELYKRYVDSYYRFIFVGRYDGVPRYFSMIRALIVQYQMLPERFFFTGGVPERGPRRVLPLGRRLRLAERARGVLRAAGRRRWPWTSRCSPTPPGRSRRRSAAPACCSRRRISSSPPSCSARSYTIGRCATRCIAGQRRRRPRLRTRRGSTAA